MLGTWKYMLFLALALPAIYAFAPSLEGVAKLRWLDDIGVFIIKSLAPVRPEANASAVDPSPQRISTRTWTIELLSG